MLSSTAGEDSLNRVSSSSSKSSSTSSSSSDPFSPSDNNTHHHNNNTQQRSKTMEEVWKDIASLNDHSCTDHDLLRLHNHPSPSSSSHHRRNLHNPNFILQDFFARPTRLVSASSTTAAAHIDTSCATTSLVPPPPPPATALSLNSSGPVFDFLETSDPLIIRPTSHHLPTNHVSNVSSFNSPFEGLDTSSGLPSFGKKRVQESDNTSCDRRHKRMIKNRESAARSRARKQAYTNELELEVAHLLEENARLKRQQEELCMAAAAAQLPKKHTLHRTSTAPF